MARLPGVFTSPTMNTRWLRKAAISTSTCGSFTKRDSCRAIWLRSSGTVRPTAGTLPASGK